jgi:hypothetical protein
VIVAYVTVLTADLEIDAVAFDGEGAVILNGYVLGVPPGVVVDLTRVYRTRADFEAGRSLAPRDYIASFVARMKATDPDYGSQRHQREHIARIRHAQRVKPCTKNHDRDDPPEHALNDRGGREPCWPEGLDALSKVAAP